MYKKAITGSLIFYCIILSSSNISAWAQISADTTLSVPTRINQSNTLFEITGGIETGSNLFHSFERFSVPDGYTARFINNNPSVLNIINRITGASVTEIYGKLESGGKFPNFNLFFLNPYGIIFGSNASLNLNGSFIATTADALQFGSLGTYNALIPKDPVLLTIDPSAFSFSQLRPQSIRYLSRNQQSSGLSVPQGKNILLLGGDIEVDGGRFSAPSGRVELMSLRQPGNVDLIISGKTLSLKYPDSVRGGDISLTNNALIDVSGNSSGSISINGENISVLKSSRLVSNLLPNISANPKSGEISLNAADAIIFSDDSQVFSRVFQGATGNSSSISIKSKRLSLINGGRLLTLSSGEGNAGDISIEVSSEVVFSGQGVRGIPSQIGSLLLTTGSGESGNISINANSLSLTDSATVFTSTFGNGDAGNISIFVNKDVSLQNLSNSIATQIRSGVEFGANGNGGDIHIQASELSIIGGSTVNSFVSSSGNGNGGNILINASNSVFISGSGDFGFTPGILANVDEGGTGTAGNISINTNSFQLLDGEVTVSNPQGTAGNLSINTNFLSLNNGRVTAETGGVDFENGANINLDVLNILKIENESLISARATANANGGNIIINAKILLALLPIKLEGSDIIANAEAGTGGNIAINSQGVFGIKQRKAIDGNQTNDIDASSQFGQSGQVQINTTTDPSQGLVELPATVIDPSTLVAQNPCKRASSSEFTRSGRGGLPPSLSQDLNGESIQVGLVEPTNISAAKPESKSDFKQASAVAQSSSQIAPAQGWVFNSKGEVVLVAYNSAVTDSQRLQTAPAGCPVF